MKYTKSILILLAISIVSCKKKDLSKAPEINILSPTEGERVIGQTRNDSLNVEINFNDVDLDKIYVLIVEKSGRDTVLYQPEINYTNSTFKKTIQLFYYDGDYNIYTYAIDKQKNISSKSFYFKIIGPI